MNISRRMLCQTMGGLLGLWSLSGCGQPVPAQTTPAQPARTYTEEEQRRMRRFRGIGGYGLEVDIFKGYPRGTACLIYDDKDDYVVGGMGVSTTGSIRPPGLFKYLKASLFEPSNGRPVKFGKRGEVIPGGDLIGQWTVPVADRIPDDLLDDLRRDPKGSLRIKIRLHREGVLLGWDIQRRPGYDPKKKDPWGNPIYVSAVHSFAGGDFREAEIINGKAVRKGWYIHPKTGERFETDF